MSAVAIHGAQTIGGIQGKNQINKGVNEMNSVQEETQNEIKDMDDGYSTVWSGCPLWSVFMILRTQSSPTPVVGFGDVTCWSVVI